ncbi:MAG: stage III sporulation protein AA [Acutalibacteraceae bacterium]|nr:stage III sporulation protein AA [Acutalibacteraceae bacterium]
MNDTCATERFNLCVKGLNQRLYQAVMKIPNYIKSQVQEVHIRTNRPVALYCGNITYYLTTDNQAVSCFTDNMLIVTVSDVQECFQNICCYSVYTRQSEIRNGYVTMRGGHRAGICGTAVYNNTDIMNIRDISSINLRIAREIKGVSESILKSINLDKGGVLICGVPSCGKTTVLRDISRILSIERNLKVCVVDERGELGGTYSGVVQNDLGMCDVLDGYSKKDGIMHAIRCMSPNVVVCDEIGTDEEAVSIRECLNSGVSVLASAHCADLKELLTKPQTRSLLDTGAFEYIVFLSDRKTPGVMKEIYTLEELHNYEIDRVYSGTYKQHSHRFLSVSGTQKKNDVI